MSEVGVRDPRSAADGSPAPTGGQAVRVIALAAAGLWAVVAVLGGGMDAGLGLGGRGPLGAMLGLLVAAPLAAAAVWAARERIAAGGPAALLLAATLGGAVWSGLSVGWAVEPSLAWLAANREAMVLAGALVGLAAGAVVPRAAERLAPVVSAAAVLPVGAALLVVAVPSVLREDGALGRLTEPVGYPNALALVAALAVPGALLVAGAVHRGPWPPRLAAAWLVCLGACGVLALSRGGLASMAVATLVTLALAPSRRRFAAVAVAAVCAAPAVAVGLTASDLTADGLDASDRAGAGALFGLLLAAGAVAAAVLAGPVADRLPRGRGVRRTATRLAVAGAVLAALAPAGAVVADAGTIAGCGGGAVANDPGRILQVSSNQRGAWWCEAGRGFLEAPVAGNGAGSFPLVQLREREAHTPFVARDPHQIWLSSASALGLVGLALTLAMWAAVAWAVARLGRGAPAGPVAIVAAAFVQAQTDWVMSWPAVALPVAAAAGVLAARAARPRRAPLGLVTEAGLAAVTLAAVFALMASAVLPWAADRARRDGAAALADGDVAAALRAADDAAGLNPTAVDPWFLRARALRSTGDLPGELRALRRATVVQPENPATWRRLAVALGDAPAARAAWIRVHLLDPHDPRARAALRLPGGGVPGDVA